MRKQYVGQLSEADRAQLHTLIGRGMAPARTLTHARILLKANQGEAGPGWTDAAIATAVEVDPTTVARIRRTYVTDGLDAALQRKAPDRVYPRKLGGEQEAHLIAVACSPPRQAIAAGPCSCWPSGWSGWRSSPLSRPRRCARP